MTVRGLGSHFPKWSTFSERFAAAYLSADRRVLGLFRVCFGLVLLYDLARRVPEASRLYSNAGVLSNHFLLAAPQASPQFSLLFACSSPAEVRFAFALIGFVYAFYCVGLCTRLAQVLAFVACTSLNSRNLFFEDGGTCTTILLAGWTLFLPLADRFSLDALLSDARAPTIRARVEGRLSRQRPFVSLAVLALLLQASVIYHFNALHKTGWTWRHGEAVHLVLWQHRVNTPLAFWLAQHEPAWFSPVATWTVVRLERALPLLLLFPVLRPYTRGAAFLAAVGLHTGIALLMTLGPFSYSMMALMLTCVPGETLDALVRALNKSWFDRLARGRSRVVARLARYLGRSSRPAVAPRVLRAALVSLREAMVLLLLVAAAIQVAVDNPAARAKHRVDQPAVLRALVMYPRMQQYWSMFAPDAPSDDGTLVVDATTLSGHHLDPFTGSEPDFEIARRGLTPHSAMLSDYFLAMSQAPNRRYDPELKRYMKRYGETVSAAPENRIVAFSAWWVSDQSPKRGETVPGPVERRLLLRARL